MKRKILYLQFIVIIIIAITIFSNFSHSHEEKIVYSFLDNNSEYVLVEKNTINRITSYLYKDKDNNYISKIYNLDNEVAINDLIKEDKINLYENRIAELLALKYPKFVVEALLKEDVKRSYILKDNKLVIYFNNYTIEPNIEEVLYLTVNYNEIKDYLNFTVILDNIYENENGYNYTNNKKSVAFTFDDSPNLGKTNKILEYLNDNLAHATFFVVGEKALRHEDLVLSIKNMGNEVASHSYNHQNMGKMTEEEFINDYNLMNDIYKRLFQEDLQYLRPPYGIIKNSYLNLIPVSYILWSVDTNDWRYRNSEYLINYVLDNIKDGDIILFHDSYDSTVAAIEKLLPLLYSKGYQVMSVSELFKIKNIPIVNNKVYHKAIIDS